MNEKLEEVRALVIRSFTYDRICDLIDRAKASIGDSTSNDWLTALFTQLAEMPDEDECYLGNVLDVIKRRAQHDKEVVEATLNGSFENELKESDKEDDSTEVIFEDKEETTEE